MAQLRDTIVAGSLRATDTLYSTTAQFSILRAPTTSGGTTFGPGTENNLLKSNGTSIYWATLAASDIPNLSTDKLNSGTLGVARGGTGVTSIANIQAGKDGDGNTISSTYLKKSGGDLTGDLGIIIGDTDKFLNFWYNTNKTAGASWRLGALGSGSSDTNYFVIQSGTSTPAATTWHNAIRIGQNTYDVAVGGNLYPLNNDKTLGTSSYKWANVYATTFTGNLTGNASGTAANVTGTVAIEHGGTGATTAAGARTNLGLGNVENTALSTWAGTSNITTVGTISTGTWQGTAIAASYIGSHSTDKLTSGTLPVARGGTGITTSTYKNAVLVGNSSTVTNAFHTIRTASGAFYATAQDGAPSFGTLPVAQGGTGQTSIANIKAGKDGDGNTISSTYLKLSGGTMTGEITSTASVGLTIRPASARAYLKLFPATDTPSDIAFGRGTTNTWSLSARDSSAGYFGLYNHIIPSWAFTVSESSNNVDFNGQISTKYITVNAWDTNAEGGEIKLAGAPGYQSGKYYACLDVNSQDFRIHSNNQVPFMVNLESRVTTITQLTLTNVLAVQYGGTGASTASAARTNLGINEVIVDDTYTTGYTTILSIINALKTTYGFPICLVKSGTRSFSDLPSGITATVEWIALVIGNSTRSVVLFSQYKSSTGFRYRSFFNGDWANAWNTV